MQLNEAVIVSALRSPIGRAAKGSLKDVRPEDLVLGTVRAVLDRVPELDPADLVDFSLGCAAPEGEHGQNIARRVAIMAGLDGLPGTTVNRFCASSLQAARMAFHAIRAGEGDAFLVGGVECVSRYDAAHPREVRHPTFNAAHNAARHLFDQDLAWTDPRKRSVLPDAYISMGWTAEFVARATGTTRRDQDDYALLSQQRAADAAATGFFSQEIAPVTLPGGTTVSADDCPRPATTAEILAQLVPAFHPRGTVTAGNASPLNDGASAAVITSAAKARAVGLRPQARIISTAVSALSPEIMGLGPVDASRIALRRAGLGIGDIDVIELNEAFAAQVVPSIRQLGADIDKVNPHGGAIALGHPFGATGVRMLATLINGLRHRDGTFGLATLCVGGGQGMAMVVERL